MVYGCCDVFVCKHVCMRETVELGTVQVMRLDFVK